MTLGREDKEQLLAQYGTLYFAPRGQKTQLHIDKDCRLLRQNTTPVKELTEVGEIPLRPYGVCSRCDPEQEVNDGCPENARKYYNLLRDADADNI